MPSTPPVEAGLWMFIVGDMLLFGLLFLTFLYYRAEQPALYQAGAATLARMTGLINTLVLLTSSWTIALAVQAQRQGRRRSAGRLLVLTLLCGAAFVVIKGFEYQGKFAAGLTLVTNDFYMFYFMLTGLHLVHVLIGMMVLVWMGSVLREAGSPAHTDAAFSGGAVFWHLVDLLWIVLFPLLYLLR